MSVTLSGIGVACAIFATGFLLAMGWHAGILAAAYLFGPHRRENNYTVHMRSSGDK